MLIFDLDDTIFETKTIGEESVRTVIQSFKLIATPIYGEQKTEQIIKDLWKYPFDTVSENYGFNEEVKYEVSKSIEHSSFNFEIEPFLDFRIAEISNYRKVLVTTGFKKLQKSKIVALGIENLFDSIIIDDVLAHNRKYKKGIFEHIIEEGQLKPESIYVIGDNPNSELKAGKELGMITIQVCKLGQERSKQAEHIITNYAELNEILKKDNRIQDRNK